MSDTQGSTKFAERTIEHFRENPIDLTVELQDGTVAVVAGFIDTPRDRWLRLRGLDGRFGPWVSELEVASVRYWTARCVDPASLDRRRHA